MFDSLTDRELETYSRQIVLGDIGYDGQLKLKNARVCLVGVGGLGAPTALKLAGMGIGHLRLVDRDVVSRSDLHRQYLYDVDAVGRPKVEVAEEKLSRLNPDITVEPIPESLNSLNAADLITGMDVVIDGLDRPEPRYIVNRTCNQLKIPYIFGAAIQTLGNAATLMPDQTFCLECFMPGLKDEDLPACGVVGVHPSALGIVSAVQVAEAVRVITGRPPQLANKLLYADVGELSFNTFEISRLENCRVCGVSAEEAPETIADRFFEETCARDGRRNFVLSPVERITIDLGQAGSWCRRKGWAVTSKGRLGIGFTPSPGITACLLQSGILIAQTPPETDTGLGTEIRALYRSILVDGYGLAETLLPPGS